MNSDNTPQKNTVIDAKKAIFDKIFRENQELRDHNYELDQLLSNFEELARDREEQHKRFEDLEESILKADDLCNLSREFQKRLTSDFAIPMANISLIKNTKTTELEFQEIIESTSRNRENSLTAAITFINESDYNSFFPEHRPIVNASPDPILLDLLKPTSNTINSIASSAFVPLISRGRAIGTLNLASSDPEKFIPGTATDAVESLARKLATVIENNLLTAQLQKLLRTDPLTGLYNRRTLDEVLPIEFARAKRYGHSLSLIMIDLDDFKLVNDRYGHPVGDMVLAETGALINNNLRRYDIGLRYGGDEFTIILPDTNHQQGLAVIDKLTKIAAIAKIQVDHDTHLTIQMSAGLATYPETPATDADALKKAADEELYKIKKAKKSNADADCK